MDNMTNNNPVPLPIPKPIQSAVLTQGPDSGQIVTEKMYGISTMWIFKWPIVIISVSLVAIILGFWFPQLVILLPIYLIANPLIRSHFHYSINEDNLSVAQGVFSRQQRTLLYSNIQNVIVKRDIFDRIFGLGTLYIENAVKGQPAARAKNSFWGFRSYASQSYNSLGSSGNAVNFTGMKAADAEILKSIILKKMDLNKNNDKLSGL